VFNKEELGVGGSEGSNSLTRRDTNIKVSLSYSYLLSCKTTVLIASARVGKGLVVIDSTSRILTGRKSLESRRAFLNNNREVTTSLLGRPITLTILLVDYSLVFTTTCTDQDLFYPSILLIGSTNTKGIPSSTRVSLRSLYSGSKG
jgi:hypothetical protein